MSILMEIRQLVRARDDLAIIAGKPTTHLVDDTIPPAALELCDDLNHVAFMKAQACPVIGLIVVQSAHIHDARWCRAHRAIHDGGARGLGDAVEVVEARAS